MTDVPLVLFEDAHVIAVAKPAGLLTQGRSGGEPTLEDTVRRHLGPAHSGSLMLGTVHRLDRSVSGVVLWALTARATRRLAEQFAARATIKEYWALVEPQASPPAPGEEGVWSDFLAGSTDARGVVAVLSEHNPGARQAVTRFRREPDGATPFPVPAGLVGLRLWPETGRTHQLRVQAGARGWPVFGDAAYGALRPFSLGIALHARSLTFEHPAQHLPITVTAPLPETWLAWAD